MAFNPATARMLLDTERMRAHVATLGVFKADPPPALELRSTWVKPGRYFNAHYGTSTESGLVYSPAVTAFIVDEECASRVLAHAGQHRCASEPRGRCPACQVEFVAPDILLQVFPGDYRLPTLARCMGYESFCDASEGKFVPLSFDVVAYRPGIRCQLRYTMADSRTVYGKVSVEKRGAGYAFRVHKELYDALTARTQRVRLAEPLAYIEELELTLVASAPGKGLVKVLRTSGADAALGRVARALGELHCIDGAVADRTFLPSDESSLLATWAILIRDMYPELGGRMSACAEWLKSTSPEPPKHPALLHRDFYDKQVLLGDDHITLLDMDTAGRGDRELDVANFCVHLLLRGVQNADERRTRAMQDAFLEAYPHELDVEKLNWYRAATFLRLAGNYALRPHWRHIVYRLVAEAERGASD